MKKLFVGLGMVISVVGSNAMAQSEESRTCAVEAGKGVEVFAQCKAGDILPLGKFTHSIAPVVCDFSKHIVVVRDVILFCAYVGYVRKDR
jgi:hypothetical protein